MSCASALIDSLPLMFASNSANIELRPPSFGQDRLVVIIVELSLVLCVTPVAIEARGYRVC